MKKYPLVIFMLGLLLPVQGLASAAFEAEAKQRLGVFQKNLQQALKQGLSQGPAFAIDQCQLQAPAIAGELSQSGWQVGRSSDRLRNPANQAPGWLEPVLASYLEKPAQPARVVPLADGAMAYVAPIRVKGLCLTCHGEQLAPAVAEQLQQRYPEDQAVGYQLNEFRGLFWLKKDAVIEP